MKFACIALVAAALIASPALVAAETAAKKDAANTTSADKATTGSAKVEKPKSVTLPKTQTISEDLVVGTGKEVTPGSTAIVHYTGSLTDGSVFDTSKKRNQPFPVQNVGNAGVIAGWNEGLIGMKVGGKRKLTIPPAAGYGAGGFPPVIPPNSTLVFEIECVDVR